MGERVRFAWKAGWPARDFVLNVDSESITFEEQRKSTRIAINSVQDASWLVLRGMGVSLCSLELHTDRAGPMTISSFGMTPDSAATFQAAVVEVLRRLGDAHSELKVARGYTESARPKAMMYILPMMLLTFVFSVWGRAADVGRTVFTGILMIFASGLIYYWYGGFRRRTAKAHQLADALSAGQYWPKSS